MFSLVSNRYERASMIVTSNKPFSLGRDLRRRHGRDRDDRPAHPPLRDPLAQRRQLPAARQRPRHPDRRQTRRNRLTQTPRPSAESRRTPHNTPTRRRDPRHMERKRPSPPPPRPTGSASRRRSLSSQPRGSSLNRRSYRWSTFQPAWMVHFSTGLDNRRSRRTPDHADTRMYAPLRQGLAGQRRISPANAFTIRAGQERTTLWRRLDGAGRRRRADPLRHGWRETINDVMLGWLISVSRCGSRTAA